MPARLLGLLALLTILTLAACEDETSPAPASTPTAEAEAVSTAAPTRTATAEATPTSEPTAAPTATRAPEPTSTPTRARTVTAADVEAVLANDHVRWRELFDILGPAEQACIREGVGEELDETLDAQLTEATEGHVVIIRCLPPDLADTVFIAGLLHDIQPGAFGVEVTPEERRCLEGLVEPLDAAALMEMLAEGPSSAEAATFVGRVYKCIPDLLIAAVIGSTGVPVAMEDLDDAALECMREAVQGITDSLVLAVAGQEEELAEEGLAFLRTVYGCAPDIFGPGLTGAPAETSTPTPTPGAGAGATAGRIAFGSDRNGNWEIYAMNADGSGVTRLTDHPARDGNPSWSPDGERIAFSSNRDGNWNIYVMNVDGSDVTRLTDNPAGDGSPSWSPDGARIAFQSERDVNNDICVMDADGSGVTRLTDNPAFDWSPSWSPDGERIAFESDRDGNWEIYVMNVDGSGTTRLTNNPQDDLITRWSPDGGRIAFSSARSDTGNYDIYVMNADGSGVTQLTDSPARTDWYPSWSPDGGRIVFQSGDDLYVMNADGSGVTRLTNVRANHTRPSWSPSAAPTQEPTPTSTVRPTQSGDHGDWTYFGPECPDGYPNCGRETHTRFIALGSYDIAPASFLLWCSPGANDLIFVYEIADPGVQGIRRPLGMHIGRGERMEVHYAPYDPDTSIGTPRRGRVVFDPETSAEIIGLLLEAEPNDLLVTVVASTRYPGAPDVDLVANFDITGLAVNAARLPCGPS